MKVDQDIVQRIKVTGIFMLQFYKVLTGNYVDIFVPQACSHREEISNGSGISFQMGIVRICTITRNLENNEIIIDSRYILICYLFFALYMFIF